jgi:hypothetical protein
VTILRSGSSTFNRAAAPSKSYGQAARLNLHADNPVGTGEFVYLQFGLPKDLHKGATVTSAHLRVQQDGDWTPVGPRTLTKQRINAKWLLSTIKWVNRPGLVTGTDVALTQSTVGDLAVWDWDVTTDVQAWVNGAPNYGWRIIADVTSTRYLRGFTARVGRPALVVEYAYPPATPTSLHPSAGAVSVSKPWVRFDTGDITAVNVQVDPAASTTAPGFDSGWVTTTANELNLASTAYAGLALNASTQWRTRVRNDLGLVSSWSQWVTFSRVAKPALTITQPTGTVLESTPPIAWTMSGMVEYQVTVALASKPSVIIHDSGRKPGTGGVYTPPKPVFTKNGAAYLITVGGWDAVDREYTTGDPRRSEATTTAVLTDDPGIWLGDPDTGDDVMLFGTDNPEPEYGEEVDTFTGIGATSSIDVLTALRGWEAPITGLLTDALDRVAVDDLDTMYRWKGDRTRELRLAWADVNVPGTIGNVQLPPRRVGTTPYGVTRGVSFSFKQTGELPFDTDL